MRNNWLRRLPALAGLMTLTLLLPGCEHTGSTGSTKVAIPNDCNKGLRTVPHAAAKVGDHAKVLWLRERQQLDKANGRLVSGASCWQGVVEKYRGG